MFKRLMTILFVAGLLLTGCGGGGAELTPQDVVESFEAAGLEVGDYQEATADDYGLLPVEPDSGIHFYIPSLGENSGGRIMSFSDSNDLEAAEEYYISLGESNAIFASHTFVRDNILVQINGSLDEEIATRYEEALAAAE